MVAALSGATQIGNSVLRVMSDAKAGLAHLTLRYLDWLARQLLPDTAEAEWLDRHGNIWLVNADGTKGRKAATLATGIVTMAGVNGTPVPVNTVIASALASYETIEPITVGSGPTQVRVRALDAGSIGNLEEGEELNFVGTIPGVTNQIFVVSLDGGVDTETDDLLRERVLFRIQNPPMGGSASDYVRWATSIPGVTRAWALPEMGPGTVTVRFMMDVLRAANRGIPNNEDVAMVRAALDKLRPVAVMDMFVQAPIPQFYDISISDLDLDTSAVRAKIEAALKEMEYRRSKPGQTMYRSWVEEAISGAVGENHHELTFQSEVMDYPGNMPFIGTIDYV